MSRPTLRLSGVLLLVVSVAAGCRPQQPFHFHEDGDLSHYVGMATDIDYPDVESCSLSEVENAPPPLTLQNLEETEVWELSLEEAVHIALANSKVMRSLGAQITSGPENLTQFGSQQTSTIYDPAVTETNPRFGVEAALAAFDTQFSTSVFWEKVDTPLNVSTGGPFTSFFAPVSKQDLGTFQASLQKTAATGGTWSLTHNVRYDQSNSPTRQFPSDWNVNLQAEFRQPLLQGAGVAFNRIAGPGGIPGFNNGVVIARINTDIQLAEFQGSVRDLVRDVERAYWSLYLAYRELDAVIAGRDSALQTWRKIHALYVVSARGGEAEKEAQAREQYFLFRAQVEQKLSDLYATENNLRYILGLAATDGRLIRPADEPTNARVSFDWHETLAEGLVRNTEVRVQKWRVKQRQMELIAAKNYLLPRLDAVGTYRWLGLGDDMIDAKRQPNPFDNAYQNLVNGNFQEWQFGIELSLPIGFRKELSGVRHAQLNLARERAILDELELELSHQLAHSVRDLDAGFTLTRTNFNRRVAAQRQVEAVSAAYETQTVTLDVLLDAQRRLAEAEIGYFRSLVSYVQAITQVHYRKGSLLEYNGVYLAEGPWPGKAYFDARRRARSRDAGWYLDYGFTRPDVISRGPYQQHAGRSGQLFDAEAMPGEGSDLEEILAPEPEPIESMPASPPPPKPKEADKAAGAAKSAGQWNATSDAGISARATSPTETARPQAGPAKVAKKATAGDAKAGPQSGVQWANFEQPARPTPEALGALTRTSDPRWKAAERSASSNESDTSSKAAETHRAPSGWKGVQR